MGILSENMRSLVDEISTVADSRHCRLQEIGEAVTADLATLCSNRGEALERQRSEFASSRACRAVEEKGRLVATNELMDAIRDGNRETFSSSRSSRCALETARLDAARQLMEEIGRANTELFSSSRACRESDDKNRLEATRLFMNETHEENHAAFSSGRACRVAGERSRLDTARQLMEEIGKVSNERRVSVSELRSNTHNLVERFGLEHRDMRDGLREKLSSDLSAMQSQVKEQIAELSSDTRQAHEIWAGHATKATAHGTADTVEPIAAAVDTRPQEMPVVIQQPVLSMELGILGVADRHREGIRLVDIGNELGVDWRTLIGTSKSLVDEGKIDKIDNMYYPKGE